MKCNKCGGEINEEENKATTEKASVALTDEEIKRALLCCTLSRSRGDCLQMCCPASTPVSCSYFLRTDEDFEDVLYVELIKDALILINRQQAEIERLQKETERFADIGKMYSEIKAEAIKAFIKKLKEKKHECGCNYRKKPVYAVTEEKIDETYKEMVGDTDVLD